MVNCKEDYIEKLEEIVRQLRVKALEIIYKRKLFIQEGFKSKKGGKSDLFKYKIEGRENYEKKEI